MFVLNPPLWVGSVQQKKISMDKYIGCDLGGTNLRAAVVDVRTGQVEYQVSVPTLAREGHDAVMHRMAELVRDLVRVSGVPGAEIGGIGVGVPGVLDLDAGTVVFLPNLPGRWENVPLQGRLAELTGYRVSLLNDVRAITYGEWKFGAGRGAGTVAVFAVGTGVGGGLVINGRLHLNFGGTVAELGHIVIDHNGPQCGCGNFGCLETYASGPAISAMGIKAVIQGLTTEIGSLCQYDLNRITPDLIAKAAREGDQIAKDIYEKAGFAIGIAAANICTAVGPERIIIGGGVAQAGDLLLDPVRKTLRERVRIMPVDKVDIVPASLGDSAGVIGVACWTATQSG